MWDVILKKLNVKCNAQPVMLHIKEKKREEKRKKKEQNTGMPSKLCFNWMTSWGFYLKFNPWKNSSKIEITPSISFMITAH